MKPTFPFKDEFPGESSSSSSWHHLLAAAAPLPRPMEGLHEAGPPPFLVKAFDMVDDLTTAHIISWSRGGQSFVVWDPHAFSTSLLPSYFKHNNFSTFIRQLNTYRFNSPRSFEDLVTARKDDEISSLHQYGFRKIDAEKWEFANEAFVRGQKHLLKIIRRRRAPSQSPPPQLQEPAVEVGRFGPEAEVDRLRRDKKVLTRELVKLRQEQQRTRLHLQHVETRLRGTEKKQQQMMRFLAGAMQNPDFLHRLLIRGGETGRVKMEPYGSQVSELEALALEMQGLGKAKRGREIEWLGDGDRELDDGFWDELLNQRF